MQSFSGPNAMNKCLIAATAIMATACTGKSVGVSCEDLAGTTIPKEAFSLTAGTATLVHSEWITPSADSQPYCKVLGKIAPIDAAASDINFQINLPQDWNKKALQYGGGGMNGVLITGEAQLADAPPGPTPLEAGYVTFGTDAGHQAVKDVPLQEFMENDEALQNHAFGAYKKTHDAATFVIQFYYGEPQTRMYYFGRSEGGREAMMVAQRFPDDYDGVVAIVPAISWVGYAVAQYQAWLDVQQGGWLGASELDLVNQSALSACDSRDGAADSVIMNYHFCDASTELEALVCPPADTGSGACLSTAQVSLIEELRSERNYGITLSNGEVSYPGFPAGGENINGGIVPAFLSAAPVTSENSGDNIYAVGIVRHGVVGDASFRDELRPTEYVDRLQYLSSLMDMTDPDLARFRDRGGKIIIKGHGADFLLAPDTVSRYVRQMEVAMGRDSTESFVRYYVEPWVTHYAPGSDASGRPLPTQVDLLGALDLWVTTDEFPQDRLTVSRFDDLGNIVHSLPLCRYPGYPHYTDGPSDDASSYECRIPE